MTDVLPEEYVIRQLCEDRLSNQVNIPDTYIVVQYSMGIWVAVFVQLEKQ